MSATKTAKQAAPKAPKEKPQINEAKLQQLKEAAKAVRTGGSGTVRRKFKATRKAVSADDLKIQQQLKKLNLQNIEIEVVNFVMEDNSVLQFTKPKVQANGANGCFLIMGHPEKKSIEDALPSLIGNQMFNMEQLKKLQEQFKAAESAKGEEKKPEEKVPQVESFETVS